MTYTVRVRGIEIVCDSLDDVDAIIDRYGLAGDVPLGRQSSSISNGGSSSGSQRTPSGDMTLLRELVEAGSVGVKSLVIGQMLSASGRGMGPALDRWAERVGLKQPGNVSPLEVARPEGKRGWRLNSGGLIVAKDVLAGK
jgi:hypothetical protein